MVISMAAASSVVVVAAALLLCQQVGGEQTDQQPGPCFLCDNETLPPKEPDKMVDVPGMGPYSCQDIFVLVPILLPDESHQSCELIRSVDNICGCSVPEKACHLCGANGVLAFPDKEVPMYSLGFDGHVPTCEIVEAHLKGSFKAGEESCSFAQNFVSSHCGCYNGVAEEPPPLNSASIGDSCRFCEDGQEFSSNDSVSILSPFQSCWELEQAALSFLANDSSECTALAGLADRAGCRCTDTTLPCDLCGGNGTITFPDKKVPFLEEEFGYVPTCIELYYYKGVGLMSVDSAFCKDFQRLSSYCGCGISDGCGFQCSYENASISQEYQDKLVGPELAATLTNMRLDTFLDISYTCEYLQTVISSQLEGDQTHDICLQAHEFREDCGCNVRSKCDMCAGNGEVTMPDRSMPFLEDHFGYVPTCAGFAVYLAQFEVFENVCKASAAFGNYCGCSNMGSCDFQCTDSGGVSDPFLDVDLGSQAKNALVLMSVGQEGTPGVDFTATCAAVESAVKSQDKGSEYCQMAKNAAALCGCSAEKGAKVDAWFRWYGAKNDKDEHRMLWIIRTAAFLSIVGSVAVVIDIMRDSKKRSLLYNQIMFCMSIFSVIYSFAYAISRVAMPMDGVSLAFENLYGTKGTHLTCSMQGFFVQLGFTAFFYSGSLSLYFAVVVAEKWSPERQASLRPYFLYTPIVIGIALSLAIIPFVTPAGNVCHVIRPYYEDTCWASIAVFFYVPGFLVVAISTLSVIFIFWKEHQKGDYYHRDNESSSQDDNAETISATASVGNTFRANVLSCMQICHRGGQFRLGRQKFVKEVLTTSSLFLAGSYVTLFWPLVASIGSDAIESEKYIFWVVTYFVVPLHGFWTALVYFRLRIVRQCRLRLANISHWWSQRGTIPIDPNELSRRKSTRRGEPTTEVVSSSGLCQAAAFPMSSVPEETQLDVIVEMDESIVLP